MNTKRFLVAAIVVWLVRTSVNAVFYGVLMAPTFDELNQALPGVFREVIPAYVVTDLIAAVAFAFLFAKAGHALGGGVAGGVKLGLVIAILSPIIGNLYMFYSVTYMAFGMMLGDSAFQLVSHLVQGAVVGAIYKA